MILRVFEVLTEQTSAAKAERNMRGVVMATDATVQLVGAILKHLDDARSLEQRIGEHFGDSSDIGNLAYKSRHKVIELLIGVAKSFKDGLTMSAGELFRLGQLFGIADTLESTQTLSDYLNELTEQAVVGIRAEAEATYRMVFDHEQLMKPRN